MQRGEKGKGAGQEMQEEASAGVQVSQQWSRGGRSWWGWREEPGVRPPRLKRRALRPGHPACISSTAWRSPHLLAQASRTLCASRLGLHPLPPRFLSPVDLSFIPILQTRNLKNREMSGTAPGTQGPISALGREMEAWIGELTSCSVGGWLGGWIHG